MSNKVSPPKSAGAVAPGRALNRSLVALKNLALALSVTMVTGCGSGGTPIVPVSGVITLDGKPLANAHVGFEPQAKPGATVAGPGAYGTTNDDGRYELTALNKEIGAVVGMNRVTIQTFKAEKGPNDEMIVTRKELLPDRYHSPSELTFNVPKGGTENANFDLNAK